MYTVTIPLTRTAPVTINWGDGSPDVTYPATGAISYTYQTSGQFDITVFLTSSTHMTNFTTSGWVDRAKVTDVKQWGESNFTGGLNFRETSLTTISAPDYPRRLVAANSFFLNCTQLQDLGNFRTDNVTNMASMLQGCTVFNGSVSNINTSLVTNMNRMFFGCVAFNQPVSSFNTQNVTNMVNMFYGCTEFNQSVPFNTSNVTNMAQMFMYCSKFNQPVPFNTSKVTSITNMFELATLFNQDLSNFQIPLVNAIAYFMNGTSVNTTNTDNLLISFASQTTQSNLNCLAAFRPRTSASDAAKATLVARGWTGIV